MTSVKWRNTLLALRGCDETLRPVMRSAGAAGDHVLHLPTRRAGAAGPDESGGLLLQPRHQQWVPDIHRQEVERLGLIMAWKNDLLTPNIKVMFWISLLLWSHHWGPWALSTISRCIEQWLQSPCSAHLGAPETHTESVLPEGFVPFSPLEMKV